MAKALKFNTKSNQEFVTVLRERVDNYFKSNNLSKDANGLMIFKTCFHFGSWLTLYLLIMLGGFSIQTNYILWALLGSFVSLTAVNIGHDAIHGAYSKKMGE